MSRKTALLIAAVALVLGLAAYRLSAQPPGDSIIAGRFERIAIFLDLDAVQAEQWLVITEQQHARAALRHEVIDELRSRFRDEAGAESPDLYTLGLIALEIHDELDTARSERESSATQLEALLTPDQRVRFEALQAVGGLAGPGPRAFARHSPFEPAKG